MTDEREYDRKRKARNRHRTQGITIPLPADPARRRLRLNDNERFKRGYFPHIFSQPFTESRRAQTTAIIGAARHGGEQAIAAPRGEGKTSNAIYDTLWLMLRKELWFPLLIGKNASAANEILEDALKYELTTNEHLAEDFPEVCVPLMELGGWAANARKQHVGGEPTQILWRKELIAFPTITAETLIGQEWPAKLAEQTCAAGQIAGAVGIEGKLRGWNIRGRRPDAAILDDIDDEDSAESDRETEKRCKRIDKAVAGLAGSGQGVARVMLCTKINRRCAAAIYTDVKQRPTWKGQSYAAVPEMPENAELWEEFVERYQRGMEELGGDGKPRDPLGRDAANFYLNNREAMDAGAKVDNEYAFNAAIAEDGKPIEHSALHSFYVKVAKNGWDSVLCEQQQDPPEEGEPEESGISERIVRSRLSGTPRRQVPDGPGVLTAFADIGKRRIHWSALWSAPGAVGTIVDYGEIATSQPDVKSVEVAITVALEELADSFEDDPFTRSDGEVVEVSAAGVDAGHWNTTIYDFVLKAGGPWRATMGVPAFRSPTKATKDTKLGRDGWYESRQRHNGRSIWVVNFDPNRWKRRTHEGFLASAFGEDEERTRGSLALFGEDGLVHTGYAKQICAEIEVEQFIEGKRGKTSSWQNIHPHNHYLDTAVGAGVMANVAGVRLLGDTPKARPVRRAKLSELAKAKRRQR